jgi:hypothetical protein
MTFQEIRIIANGPCITNQLRDVNTICRKSWYIAAHIWKIYDFKIEVVPHICHRHETPFRLSFQTSLEKKRNSIVTFQSGHLTEQPTTMNDLACFELKMFRNCPIRILVRNRCCSDSVLVDTRNTKSTS